MKYQLKHQRIDIYVDATFNEKTLLDFLEYYKQSRKNRYLLLQNKKILINHKQAESINQVLHNKDIITIFFDNGKVDFEPSETECKVVYEDDFVYIVHKDVGDIIYGDKDALANKAARYQINHNINSPVLYIHRLDEDTTGLVLFVKIPFFKPWFDEQLAKREIHRYYLAITTGNARINQGFNFKDPIGRDRHVSGKYRISSTGLEAYTKARCIAKENGYLLMKCELETGRTHQIRVHLSASNHPIVNDKLYGLASTDFKNMGLWAYKLSFKHPLTNEEIIAEDYFNNDFKMFKKYIYEK